MRLKRLSKENGSIPIRRMTFSVAVAKIWKRFMVKSPENPTGSSIWSMISEPPEAGFFLTVFRLREKSIASKSWGMTNSSSRITRPDEDSNLSRIPARHTRKSRNGNTNSNSVSMRSFSNFRLDGRDFITMNIRSLSSSKTEKRGGL